MFDLSYFGNYVLLSVEFDIIKLNTVELNPGGW